LILSPNQASANYPVQGQSFLQIQLNFYQEKLFLFIIHLSKAKN
jgi:hypothetical protein